jgi:hypothetical protein
MSHSIPVYEIALPEYKIEPDMDWLSAGRKLDRLIETHFREGPIAIRCIGLVDHPGWSLDDLVATIVRLGTDKYDPRREGLYYARDEVSDIHAGPAFITKEGLQAPKHTDGSPMAMVLELFYDGALADRGYSIRLDVVMIYDLNQLEPCLEPIPVEQCYEYRFKDPEQRQRALLGVIKILR